MPLTMNRDVFITCAVTGAGDICVFTNHNITIEEQDLNE